MALVKGPEGIFLCSVSGALSPLLKASRSVPRLRHMILKLLVIFPCPLLAIEKAKDPLRKPDLKKQPVSTLDTPTSSRLSSERKGRSGNPVSRQARENPKNNSVDHRLER